jgi:hypothetical protein
MVVFFRGLHCPVCRAQLTELNRRLDELEQAGIDVIAVSGETRERTTRLAEDWRLERLPLGCSGSDVRGRNRLTAAPTPADHPAPPRKLAGSRARPARTLR